MSKNKVLKAPSIISRSQGYVTEMIKREGFSTAVIDTMVAHDVTAYQMKLMAYDSEVTAYIDKVQNEENTKIESVVTALNAEIEDAKRKIIDEDGKKKGYPVVKSATAVKLMSIKDGISRSKKEQYSVLVTSLTFLIKYAHKGAGESKEESQVEGKGDSPLGTMVIAEDGTQRPRRGVGRDYVDITPTPNKSKHVSGSSVTTATGSHDRMARNSTASTARNLVTDFSNTLSPGDLKTVVDPATTTATETTAAPAATDALDAGGEAKRLQSVAGNVRAMEDFIIGKSEKQLYYMPMPMKTALEKAEKSDMLRVINKTIREYGAVIGITECTVDMQNSHSELAAYYDILVHRVKGWADSVATLNDPDTPLWKYNPDVLLERRVAYDAGLAEFQKQFHKDGAVLGAEAQRSPNDLNRIAVDKMMVAKRKFEKVTSADRLKSDNSESGNRRLAHMFLKSVPPLHMFKKDLAPTSHMSQAPQSQRKMRKVLHTPLQMGPPIVIQFTNVMMKTTHDSDEEY